MAMFNVTPEDMVIGKAVDPGWYPTEVAAVEDKFTKKDNALMSKVTLKIIGKKDAGVKLYLYFTEKAPGFVVPFVEALSGQKFSEGGGKVDINPALVGRQLEVFVQRGEYNGKPTNDPQAFAPMGTNIKGA